MSALYHAALYHPLDHAPSLWAETAGADPIGAGPLEGETACEVAVIGGGYSGLSAALHLARFGIAVRLLESGPIGWGASGRNGGFCSLGGHKLGYQAMRARFGAEQTRRFFSVQQEAVALVAALARDEGFDIDAVGQGEYIVAHGPRRMAALAAARELYRDLLGLPTRLLGRAELAETACHGPGIHGALLLPIGFGLHPLKYARGLAGAAEAAGALLHPRSPVVAWRREGGRHRLITPGGSVLARMVAVATNGYTPERLHRGLHGRTLPALSNIVVTRPLSAEERARHGFTTHTPLYDTRRLLYYFRMLPDGRFLFGSRGGLRGAPSAASAMHAWMTARLHAQFPAWREIEITHYWRGLVCLTRDLVAHVGQLADEPTIYYALGYHGTGVAMAGWCGRAMARLIAGAAGAADLPAPLAAPLARYPWPGLRRCYLAAAYGGFKLADGWR